VAARLKLAGQALALLTIASLLGLFVWKLATESSGGVRAAVTRGDTPMAPAFTLPDLVDGSDVTSASLFEGKVVVLNFWASWCAPCREEAPLLEAAWQQHRDDGVVVVGIDARDLRTDGRSFVREFGITYPNVYDGPGSIVDAYGVTGFPETYFLDRQGRIVHLITGPVTEESLAEGIEKAAG
jgi:cytochrome c biogenesis protein CcmG, thiol:disulfide interchange protein DsbE